MFPSTNSFSSVQEAVPSPALAGGVKSLVQRLVDWLEDRMFPGIAEPWIVHSVAVVVILAAAVFLRRIITGILFAQLKRISAKPDSKLDKRLFPALEAPVATLVMVLGIITALSVFQMPAGLEHAASMGSRAAITTAVLWGILCAGGAIIDHMADIGRARNLSIAAFVPLIKKTLAALFGVFGILVIAESLGCDVKDFLAGLGIGGLAFALAAQDTLANLFGSFVVMMDNPFHVGDVVRIGSNEGSVEDIGLRSTRLRTGSRSQIIIPNKTVASESVINFSRMPQRRVDQTIGLSYDASPEQIEKLGSELRALLRSEPGIHKDTIVVTFAGFGESSLDLEIVYFSENPDWSSYMALRERVNLAIMRLVGAHGLSFAFPTQTVVLDGPVAKSISASVGARQPSPGSVGSV